MTKEVFGQLGYRDGSRFLLFEEKENPEVEQLKQQLQELQTMVEQDQIKQQGRMQVQQMKSQTDAQGTQIKSLTDMEIAKLRAQTDIQKELIAQQTDIKEAQIKKEDSITKRGELLLQKEALLNQIADGDFDRAEKQVERDLELDAQGDTGTIKRDRYNKIPFARG